MRESTAEQNNIPRGLQGKTIKNNYIVDNAKLLHKTPWTIYD